MQLIGIFKNNKTIIKDNDSKSWLINKSYGTKKDSLFFLDIFETLYLLEKKKLKTSISFEDLITTLKKEIIEKYQTYKYFRDLGYVTKSALKFGFDFRVYPKGKNDKNSHTKYVIQAIKELDKIKATELAKTTRMALSLKTKLILSIVGNDLEVINYEITKKD